MANNLYMLLTTDKNNLVSFAAQAGGPSSWFYRKLSTLVGQLGIGAFNSKLDVVPNLVAANGTVTFSSIASGDTVTIGATVFTGDNTASTAIQFLTNVTPSGAADIVAAASLAAKINAQTVTSKLVVATASGAIVTVTALVPGLLGNFFPIAISAHGSVSGTGKLTNGTQGTIASYRHGL